MVKKVPGHFPRSARILWVGECPAAVEEERGRPFVGPAGALLRRFMQEVGIDDELDIAYTNICKYRAPKDKIHHYFLDGGIPNELVIEGLSELIDEIRSFKPHLIVPSGNFPLWALDPSKVRWVDEERDGKQIRGFTGISNWRGSILYCRTVPGFKLVPTFHPSYILQEGMGEHGTFKTDLARIAYEGTFPEVRRPEKNVILVREQPELLTNYNAVLDDGADPTWEPIPGTDRFGVRDRLLATPETPTTLDIEYIGSKLLCVGLTTHADEAFVLPTSTLGDLLYMESIVKNTKSFNAQNSMFDASIMEWHYNIPILKRVVFDTMVCAYAANVELPKDLGYLCSVYTDQPNHKDLVNWKEIKKGKQKIEIVYAYNGMDVWTQHEIMEEQTQWELTDPVTAKVYDFLMQLLVPLWEMSKRGIRVDLDLMKHVNETLEGETAEKSFKLMFLTGMSDLLNVASGPQLGKLLFQDLGLEPRKMNKSGPATDDKTLAALVLDKDTSAHAKEIITLVRQIKSMRSLKSKFFDIGFDDDGRMRGMYNATKTVTIRLASQKFWPTDKGTNQQNIPTDKRARRAFLADKGKVFGYADLEKAESLVVAHLTMDPLMLHDHSSGQNAHKNLGSKLFDKPASEIEEDEYYLAKRTRHAGNYMQGHITFMRNVNQVAHKTGVSIDEAQAKRFIQIYRGIHLGLPAWWKEVEAALYKGKTLYNLLGFRRVFFGHIRSILPEGVAFVPQSTVGQVLNVGLLNISGISCPYVEERGIWQNYLGIKEELAECGFDLLQQIHDAVGFQCWEKDIDRVVPLLRRAMSIPLTNPKSYEDFIIPVEVLVDLDPEHLRDNKSNWGDTKKYTKDLEITHA